MAKKRVINLYTVAGRVDIHKELDVDKGIMHAYMRCQPSTVSIEFSDCCISRFAAQSGRCAITGQFLELDEIYCHRKRRNAFGGQNKYHNLVIVNNAVHDLIHATNPETINTLLAVLQLTTTQLSKLNRLRELAGMTALNA